MKLSKATFMAIMVFSMFLMPAVLNQGFSNSIETATKTPLPFLVSEATWNDNCTNPSLWNAQTNESGFSTLNTISDSGNLVSVAGYFSVTEIIHSGDGIQGPLFTRMISPQVPIRNLSAFQADLEFAYEFDEVGFLSLYLFDESRNIIAALQISDDEVSSASAAICSFQDESGTISGSLGTQYLFSWRAILRINYEPDDGSIIALIDDGSAKNQTLLVKGQFDEYREIKYIGIQACRASSNYVGEHLKVHDIQLAYRELVVEETNNPAADSSTPVEDNQAEDDPGNNSSLSNENRGTFPIELAGVVVGLAIVGYATYVWPRRKKDIAEPLVKTALDKPLSHSIDLASHPAGGNSLDASNGADTKAFGKGIHVLRGCELVGSEFVYKVKVANNTKSVITNVSVTILSYPEDCMSLNGDPTKAIQKIEPGGYRSPQFPFSPTKDCVQGTIQATVSFVDHKNEPHSSVTRPFQVKSVCDLLKPFKLANDVLEKMMQESPSTSFRESVPWNAQDLFEKAKMMLTAKNFHLADASAELGDGFFKGTAQGSAIGKYTGKRVEVRIQIAGNEHSQESEVSIIVSGDDDAMLPITLSEFSQGMSSWLCIYCGAPLNPIAVANLQHGCSIQCDFCTRTLTFHR